MTISGGVLLAMMAMLHGAAADPRDFASMTDQEHVGIQGLSSPPLLPWAPYYLSPNAMALRTILSAFLSPGDLRKHISQKPQPFEDMTEDFAMKMIGATGRESGNSGPGDRGISGYGRKLNTMKKVKSVRSRLDRMCYLKLCSYRPLNYN